MMIFYCYRCFWSTAVVNYTASFDVMVDVFVYIC